jgi:hypothetical protein
MMKRAKMNTLIIEFCALCDYKELMNDEGIQGNFTACNGCTRSICKPCVEIWKDKYAKKRTIEDCYCKFSVYNENNFKKPSNEATPKMKEFLQRVRNGDHSMCEEFFGGPYFECCPECDPEELTIEEFEEWLLSQLCLPREEALSKAKLYKKSKMSINPSLND